MKVMHVISSGGMYGAESVILNISRLLNENSHHAVIGMFANSANMNIQLHKSAQDEGIESYLIPCDGQVDLSAMEFIRNLVLQIKPDIVHAHGYKADAYVYLALRKLSIPFVSTCHTWHNSTVFDYIYGVIDRRFLRRFPAVVAVSDEVSGQLLRAGVPPAKISLIGNGIDLRPYTNARPSLRESGEANGSLLVGLVGRLANEKGVDIFFQAAARVLSEIPNVRFTVIGDGPDRSKLQGLLKRMKIDSSVTMLGRRDDMPSVYASLDLMVSASRQEGFPMAILEGMASGLPIVATSVGSVPSIIVHEQSGVLVEPENVEALADQMVALLKDSARRQRLGRGARERVEKEFSVERLVGAYLSVYQRAIDFVKVADRASAPGGKVM